MQKPDFETYQKRFRDFEILPKFSETHVFRGTIRHPWKRYRFCQKWYTYIKGSGDGPRGRASPYTLLSTPR